eukprot:m.144226 g.144226  ORF g.144226 m.144226 type:complete len:4359 (-) comp14100_c0_seq10:3061-16137(-)
MAIRVAVVTSLLAALVNQGTAQAFGAGTGGAVIHSISPTNGSIGGGTLVTITGSGFQRGGIVGGTNVFIGHLACPVIDYWSSDERLICRTEEMHNFSVGYSYMPVRVAMHSFSAASFAQGQFRYKYWDSSTPFIRRSSSGVLAGGELQFGGLLRAANTDDLTVTVGGMGCALLNEYVAINESGVDVTHIVTETISRRRSRRQASDPSFVEGLPDVTIDSFSSADGSVDIDAREVAEDTWDDVNEACTLPDELEGGRYNYTVEVAPSRNYGFGNAKFFERSSSSSGSRDIVSVTESGAHVLTVYPVITSLSAQASGALGGHTVSINGHGFSETCSSNSVELAGAPCAVIECSTSTIRCIVANSSTALSSGPYPGTTGLTERMWLTFPSTMNFETSISSYSTPNGETVAVDGVVTTDLPSSSRYSSEQVGVFVAPHTANYRFWVLGDDHAQVELNRGGDDPAGLQVVASLSGSSSTSSSVYTNTYTRQSSQKSAPIALVAGQRYAFRSRHANRGGAGYVQAAVEILGAPASAIHPQYHRVNERQEVIMTSTLVRQMQRIVVHNTSGGTIDLLGGSEGRYNFSVSPSGSLSGASTAVDRVVSRCSRFTITTDTTQWASVGTLIINVQYRCTPSTVNGIAQPWPLLRISTQGLAPFATGRRVNGLVQNVQNPTDPLSGSFTISLAGVSHPSATVAYTTSQSTLASRLRTALRGFATVQDVRVTASGDLSYAPRFVVDFLVPQAFNFPPIEFDLTSTRGTNASVMVSTEQNGSPGSILYDPIPARFLEVRTGFPAAVVTSNGIKAACGAPNASACTFVYNNALTPVITAVSSSGGSGVVTVGDTITITGTMLQNDAGGVQVNFGGSACAVTVHTSTQIQCTVGHSTRGDYVPEVIVAGLGRALSTNVVGLSYGFSVSSIGPLMASYRGGTRVTLTGTGFSRDASTNAIAVDGAPCEVVTDPAPLPNTVICIVPAATSVNLTSTAFVSLAPNSPANLVIGFFDNHTIQLTYTNALTPSITDINPSEISAAITTNVTIFGAFMANGFTLTSQDCVARMDFVSPSGAVRQCTQLQLHDAGLNCLLVRGPAFPVAEQRHVFPRLQLCVDLSASVAVHAIAHPEPLYNTVDLALRVESLTPQTGSLAGGTEVTIQGGGFADDSARIVRSALTFNYLTPMVVVNLTLPDRNIPCLLTSSNFTTIRCITVFPSAADVAFVASPPEVYVGGGFNSEVAVSVNDIRVLGCVGNPPSSGPSQPPAPVTGPIVYVPGTGTVCPGGVGIFCVSWQPADEDNHIQFTISGQTSGYLALGITDVANAMGPADVVMCWMENGAIVVSDRFNPQRGVNVEDLSQDVTLVSSNVTNGVPSCTFKRALSANDANDRSIPAGVANLLWAMGPMSTSESGTPAWHGLQSRGGFTATLLQTQQSAVDNDSGSGSDSGFINGTYNPNPEFTATVQEFSSHLQTSCSFNYANATTPTIASISPSSGAGQTTVLISGSGFSAQPTVFVGDVEVQVVSFTDSSVTVTVPQMTAGIYFVRVGVSGVGFAAHPAGAPVAFHSLLQLTSVQPSVSSMAGGLVITYSGAGFASEESSNVLTINGVRAHVIHSEFGELVAVTPHISAQQITAATVQLTVPTVELSPYHFGQAEQTTFRYSSNVTVPASGVPVVGGIFTLPESYSVSDVNAITYSPSSTPIISSVTPTSGQAGDPITVTGQNLLGSNVTEVLIGAESCSVTSLNATHVVCTLGATPAGNHRVFVTVHGLGTASGTVMFTASLQITTVSQATGSFGGGTIVTINGNGFGGGLSTRRTRRQADGAWGGWIIYDRDPEEVTPDELGTRVTLCGLNCTVNSSSYSDVVCETPKLNSPESIAAFNAEEVQQLTSDTYISETASQSVAAQAFDYDFTTDFAAGSWVGLDLGANSRVLVSRMRFFPAHQQAARFEGSTFETSVDGINWTQLQEGTPVTPHQGWNWANFDVTGQSPARFVRMVSQSSEMHLAMLEVYGHPISVSSSCPVVVETTSPLSHPSLGLMETTHSAMATSTGPTFTYSVANTPIVTSVTPRYGSSLGGDRVTITGQNLATNVSNAVVQLSGVDCAVVSASPAGDSIECITGARGPIARHNSVPLSLTHRDLAADRGFAVVNESVRFRFLDKWSEVNTWLNDEPPIDGDSVIIPIDQTILLDVQPPRLFLLLVQGALVFDRINVNLDASYILVQGGLLEVGTEDEPFLNTTTITLHGDRRRSIELPFIGAKVLAVADRGGFTSFGNGTGAEVPDSQRGVLDIHGKPRIRTWTKVAPGVYPAGSTRIITSEPTDFAPGEKVVVTAPHQEVTVAARIDPFTFDIVEPLARQHVSEWYNHTGAGGTFELDMRFEVALLTRNVVIQGAGGPRADGTPTITAGDNENTSVSQLFGVHTGAFHGGFYRLENAEFRHCGQAGVLGRYCMHFHRVGDAPPPNSYLKSNSIHHSFQRATTVHGTHHSLVQNNVAYHVMGHTYFVEDGDETFNTFDNNIGIFTKPSHMMLKSDRQPATFWTAIPTNLWRNNVATDSSARGAWYELTNQGITLEFRNNSFHHNSGIGFRNYPNYSPPAPQWFHNNSYFRNGGNGLFYKQGGDNHHVYSKFAENGVDLFWKKYKINSAAVERNIPNVQDCIFWGGRGAQAIFAPQHEFWSVNGSTFINYDDNQASGVLSACAGCCSANSMRQGAYTYRFQRLHWINSTKRTHWTCPYKQIMYDLDGSLTGHQGGTALPFYKFNEWADGCFNDTTGDYDMGGWAPGGMVCNGSLRVRRLQLQGQEPEELDRLPISFKKSEMVADSNGNLSDIWGGLNWTRYTTSGVLYDGQCYAGNGAPDWIPADFSGCDVMDSLDWINYRTCNSDFSGWAIPMVTQHNYWSDIDWHVDFQQLDLRWSEPFYLNTPANLPLVNEESVMLKWPYVDYRYNYRVEWDGSYNNSDTLPWTDRSTSAVALTRNAPFGNARILREDDSLRTTGTKGLWDISINPWSGVNLTSSNPMKLHFQALQCGPNMCGLPGDIPATWPAPRYWSDPETWVEISRQPLNTISVNATGLPPVEGEHVEIPQGMYVIMDVDPPRLGKLVVVGRLKFDGDSQTTATASTVRRLNADRILVWGILEVGDSPSSPFPGTAEIMLSGVRTSPTLVATDQHFLGNKNLVVFGYAKLYGQQRSRTWTTLANTAVPGATSITLSADPTGWSVGDTIMIAPTEYPQPVAIEQQAPGFNMTDYAATQMEERQITAISGRTLQFSSPLRYRHFAGSIDSGAGYNVDLRAHVGLLSSNVVVRGDLSSTPVAGQPNWYQGYGGHIVVGEVNYGSASEIAAARRRGEILGTVQKLGSLDASNIAFRDMGKLASEHGAITFRYFSNLRSSQYPLNRVTNCMFRSTWNHAVYTDKSFEVSLVGNSIQNTFYSGVQIDQDSRSTRIDNNLLMANQRSPDQYTPRCTLDRSCWVHPFSAFHIENTYVTSVSGNVAAGAEDTGFTLYPVDSCTSSNRAIRNNEAYGALVGLFLLDTTSSNQGLCRVIDGFKAWKNAHIGVLTVDQSVNIRLQRVHVADNHQGISLNYVKAGGINHFSQIMDSTILGSTTASTCAASVDCRAIAPNDLRGLTCGSEFGSTWRRAGIVMPQYTNLPKTCARGGISPCRPQNLVNRPCSLPWENRFGNVDIQHAVMNITNTAFRYWSSSDCGRTSRAIQINPSQPDFTPVVYASGLTWNDYDPTSRFVLSDVSQQRHEATACRTSSCDAVNYFTIEDLDGSTHGQFWDDGTPIGPVTLLSAHNAPASDSARCRTDSATGTFVCRSAPVARVILESNPPRFTARRVGPVTVRRYGAAATEERVMWSVGPFPQGCSCQKHFAQFTFQAMANHTYDVNSTGVLEDRNRLSFPHPDPNFCVLLKIFFSRPNPVRVTLGSPDGTEIPRITTGIRPTTTDSNPSGANLMDPQSRQLFIKLCGGTSQQWWLVYENRVMVSATLSMTPDEFFGATASSQQDALEIFVSNMAALLGISASQIRVTCVHPVGDPVCLGSGRSGGVRMRRSTTPGLVVDMVISPLYTVQDVSTTVETGPNGTNITATYVTNETVSDANRTAQLEAIFDFFQNNQTEIIDGLEDLPGNFTVLTFDVEWEQTTTTTTTSSTFTTTTTVNGTFNLEAAGASEEAVPMSAIGGAAAALLVLIVIVAVLVQRRQNKAPPKEPTVYYDGGIQNPTLYSFETIKPADVAEPSEVAETSFDDGFNPNFGDEDEKPSYFAKNRAELVQDSLMIRVAKTPSQAGYIDTAPEPEVEVRVNPDAEDYIRPSALQHTEEPTWQPAPMSPDGRISFVNGSVTNKPATALPVAAPQVQTLRRKPSMYNGFDDDEDGLPGTGHA